ncbi:MAG: cytochrome C oxidase subunit I [Aquificae bacterium]|nr:cytochrome C oxidase subunit I [Aquificota bacterium]
MPWFFLFVTATAVGGLFALLVAVARTPGISHLFPPEYFYHGLVGHVDSALIVGLLSFLVFLWHRVFGKPFRKGEFLLTSLGFLFILLSALLGRGKALFNNYVPTIVDPLFFAGLFLFFGGLFITALRFSRDLWRDLFSRDLLRSVLAVSVLNSLLLPVTFGLSLLTTPGGLQEHLYFERLFWFGGHTHQFVNACLLIALWILLSDRKVRNFLPLTLLLLLFPVGFLVAQLFIDPLSPGGKKITDYGYMVGIGVPTLLYGAYITLREFPVWDFRRSVLKLSFFLYLYGALMGYAGVGMDLRVPAHYHTVIASILVAVMACTLLILKEEGFVRRISLVGKSIPFFYGFGMLLFVTGLFWAGMFGAPRKTPGEEYIESFSVYAFMLLMGAGSILSVLGGASFVLYILVSTLKGREYEKERREGEEA